MKQTIMSQETMSHEQVLLLKVGALRTRIRLLLAQQWFCVGLAGACAAGLLLAAATRFQWWSDALDYLWALLLVGGIAGLLIGWTRRITPLVAAQIADERAGLKERLSTAVELSGSPERSEVAEAQIVDAAQHAQEIQPSCVLPWRAPRQLRYLAVSAAVLAAAVFLPDLPIFHSPQERLDREAMRVEGAALQRVAKEIEKKSRKKPGDENEAILRRIAQNLKQLGKEQARNRISKKQAMLQMKELQKQLRETESKLSGGARKSLDKVAGDLQQAAQQQMQQGNGEGAKALRQMAESLQKRDFEAARKQLEELARRMQSGRMTAEEAGRAAETLQSMARAMEGSGLQPASQQMKEASRRLQQAAQQTRQFQQQMQAAKSDAERRRLQQQMAQALSRGAQSAAQQTRQAGGT